MATATVHIAQGLDGKPHVWPAAAISFNPKTGEYKDFKGRTVKAPADRMGVALDSLQPAKRHKPVGRDTSAEDTLLRRLLPTLKKMANESKAEATDDMESENEMLFGGSVEDEAQPLNEANEAYKQQRQHWQQINANNLRNRGRAMAPVAANASKGH